eukprot:TRINITY_DN24800_c0_g1_i1.p1 TRINITY_DN24800_c0_g1~~TRINITY_DN24800_c0_g1_i1.p1  ORF type:complete len:348 (+),score=63.86 TRINITY_DN24800_c0_g1_i1:51-1094(+)
MGQSAAAPRERYTEDPTMGAPVAPAPVNGGRKKEESAAAVPPPGDAPAVGVVVGGGPDAVTHLLESCEEVVARCDDWAPRARDLAALDRLVSCVEPARVAVYCRSKLAALPVQGPRSSRRAEAEFVRDAARDVARYMQAERVHVFLPEPSEPSEPALLRTYVQGAPPLCDAPSQSWDAGCTECADLLHLQIPASVGVLGEVSRRGDVVNIDFDAAGEDGRAASAHTEEAGPASRDGSVDHEEDHITDDTTNASSSRRSSHPVPPSQSHPKALYNSLIDAHTGFTARALLAAPLYIPAASGRPAGTGVVQVVNRRAGGAFTAQDEALLQALCVVLASELVRERKPEDE